MQVLFSKKFSFWIFLILFLVPNFVLWRVNETQTFHWLVVLYTLCFIGYLGLASRELSTKTQLVLFLLASLPYFLSTPQLSVDFYRFLWDGTLLQKGMNPFDFLPPEALQKMTISNCETLDLYSGISDLSKQNYTPYPTVNQWYFFWASKLGGSLLFQTNILRLLILTTVLVGWHYAKKNLSLLVFPTQLINFLVFNPLFIIESIGNVHFEAVMISWMMVAIYFILQKKWLLGGLFLSIAIQIKLVPFLLLPFVLRYFGWGKTVLFGGLILGLNILLFGFFIDSNNSTHFLQSLQLYFSSFEFNSILLYPYLNFGEIKYGWNLTRIYAPKLAQWSFFLLLTLAFYGGEIDKHQLCKRWLLASLIYLSLSSTLHPWYWIFPLSLSLFYPNKSTLIGTFITFLSYGLYNLELDHVSFRAFLSALNMAWLTYALYEFTRPEKPRYFSFDFLSGTGS
ncbi:MAG: hypothetical protein N4A41_00835 [Crocinitomicaceae bacterium]|jgi:hypothetical protein|nr:hypothetical protein [Crocinitomicaceae bacterium]